MRFSPVILSLALLMLITPVAQCGTLVKPSVLFFDLVDAANCLETVTPDDPDVGLWTAEVIFDKIPSIPECADCYNHVDGVNYIGVLPVVKDTLREPMVVHSPKFSDIMVSDKNGFTFKNHGPEWGMSPAKLANGNTNVWDINASSDAIRDYTVTKEDILSMVGSTDVVLLAPDNTPSTLTHSPLVSSFEQVSASLSLKRGSGLGYVFNNKYVITNRIEPLPTQAAVDLASEGTALGFAALYGVKYPVATIVAADTGILGKLALVESSGMNRSVLSGPGLPPSIPLINGTLQFREDPWLPDSKKTPGTVNNTPTYYPAYRYYDGADLTIYGKTLKLCGLSYEVKSYGMVYDRFLDASLAHYNNASSGYKTNVMWVDKLGRSVTTKTALFNGITGLWTGLEL